MKLLFWLSAIAAAYPYAIYPLLLMAWNRLAPARPSEGADGATGAGGGLPGVSVIVPVHNEAARIRAKVLNLLELDYPPASMQLIVVGDGCTDDSLDAARAVGGERVEVHALPERAGKAAALNEGLRHARGAIIVFTDASILLEPASLRALVARFADPAIGCVSGEDYVEGGGTEGLYGRLELLLRREEARLHSIAGASGCYYAIRRSISRPFRPGMAPDFLSVLETVQAGYRAVCEPLARGAMTATSSQREEYARKVRTFLRGITALFANAVLLDPVRHPRFAFILWSHKLARWLGPIALTGCLVASLALAGQPLYGLFLLAQLFLYALAVLAIVSPAVARRLSPARICGFFLLVNVAAAKAMLLWVSGVRQELWSPTRR